MKNMLWIHRFFLLFLFAQMSNALADQQSYWVFKDESNSKTFEQIENNPQWFISTTRDSAGLSPYNHWVRVELNNPTADYTQKYVVFESLMLDQVTLFSRQEQGVTIQKAGFKIPRLERSFPDKYSIFEILLTPYQKQVVYFQFLPNYKIPYSHKVVDDEALTRFISQHDSIHIILVAIIFSLALYNSLLAFSVRDNILSWYALFMLANFIVAITVSRVYEISGFFYDPISIEAIAGIAVYILSYVFIWELFKNNLPPVAKKIVTFGIIFLLLHIPLWILNPSYVIKAYALYGSGVIIFASLTYLIYQAHVHRHPLAKLVAIGWFVYLSGTILSVSSLLGLLPVAYETSFIYGITLEGFIFSLILAYRMKLTHQALQKAEIDKHLLEQVALQKDQFIASVSHELRTPLNGIIGMHSVLHQQITDEKQLKLLNNAEKASHGLLGLVNDILDFSKLQSGKLQLNPSNFNFSRQLRSALDTVELLALDKRLNLSFEESNCSNIIVYADAKRLDQILLNLLSNAIKFTAEGHITLRSHCQKNTASVDVTIEICDTGRGISSSFIPKLFDRFSQESTTDKLQTTGTGLGLAITKSLVDLMGGTIEVMSTEGQGTIFKTSFTFPVQSTADPTADKQDQQIQHKISHPIRILYAEDNKLNQLVVEQYLLETQAKLSICENGLEALQSVKHASKPFDLILMDMQMPEMNGIEATQRIRQIYSAEELPIIGLSANVLESDKSICLDAGMNSFLAKPIKQQELMSVLVKYAYH